MKIISTLALLTGLALTQSAPAQNNWPQDCDRCGRVTQIEKVRDGKSGTGGAVAGAVVGGLLGNQVGGGDGKKVATAAGAVGGAYAGKKMAEENREYKITVIMRDGTTKTVRQETLNSIKVGSMVRVKDGKAKLYRP